MGVSSWRSGAIPTHALHGLAHLPVHPLLLTYHAFGPLGSFMVRESRLPRKWTWRCERRCRLEGLVELW
eukprot:8402033-Pyramimonas_sp.AAC.1